MSNTPLLNAYRGLKREIALIASGELKRFNVGEKQMIILFYLAESNGLTPTDLAFYTQSDPAAVSRALQCMGDAGLVRRKPDPHDSRRYFLELTAKGKDKANELEAVRAEINQRIQKTLGAKDLKELERLMRTVADGLQAQRGKS